MSGMEYKGFIGSIYYSDEDEVFHGKLEGIRDLVAYEGTDVASLKRGFREVVDDYLATCKKGTKSRRFLLGERSMCGLALSCANGPLFMLRNMGRN